ncbi:MAG: hypothetical protein ACTHL8_16310, partial [Burkholderiaceae bacterium]
GGPRGAPPWGRVAAPRAPGLATSAWRKEERRGVFVDYNQNARDRTVCSAYSVRARPDARVSTPVDWRELERCDPASFTLWTIPARWRRKGDPHEGIDERPGSLEALLEWSARDEAGGVADGPLVAGTRRRAGTTRPKEGPLVEIARAEREADAQSAADAWRAEHADVARHLAPRDVLVDRMRGRSSLWYRVRVNLARVPEALRPLAQPVRGRGRPQAPKTRASS